MVIMPIKWYFSLELKDSKVSGLNNVSQNRWDNDIINDLGNERDGQLIKQIPIQRRNRADSLFRFKVDAFIGAYNLNFQLSAQKS